MLIQQPLFAVASPAGKLFALPQSSPLVFPFHPFSFSIFKGHLPRRGSKRACPQTSVGCTSSIFLLFLALPLPTFQSTGQSSPVFPPPFLNLKAVVSAEPAGCKGCPPSFLITPPHETATAQCCPFFSVFSTSLRHFDGNNPIF